MNEYVTLSIKKEIGYIEFFHPQSNALPANILTKLAQTISDSGKNNEIKVIVLGSGGERALCAGDSFDELTNISKSPIVYPDLNCTNLNGKSIRSLSDILNMTYGLMDPLNESCPKINGHMKKNNERIIIIINNLITRHAF